MMVDDDRLPLKEGEVPEYKSVRLEHLVVIRLQAVSQN